MQDFWHLDLREDSAALVIAQSRGVANCKCVRTLDSDLAGFTSVQFGHSLNFTERDKVAILETMASLVQAINNTLLVLVNRNDHARQRLLARRIYASKLRAEVVKCRTSRVCIEVSVPTQ